MRPLTTAAEQTARLYANAQVNHADALGDSMAAGDSAAAIAFFTAAMAAMRRRRTAFLMRSPVRP